MLGSDGSVRGAGASVRGAGASMRGAEASVRGAGASLLRSDASTLRAGASVLGAGASRLGAGASVLGAVASVLGTVASVLGTVTSVLGAGASVLGAGASVLELASSLLGAGPSVLEVRTVTPCRAAAARRSARVTRAGAAVVPRFHSLRHAVNSVEHPPIASASLIQATQGFVGMSAGHAAPPHAATQVLSAAQAVAAEPGQARGPSCAPSASASERICAHFMQPASTGPASAQAGARVSFTGLHTDAHLPQAQALYAYRVCP